jgi:hypothetical protein
VSRTPKTSRPTRTPPTPRSDASAGTSFNLRSLVREVAANSTLRNYDDLTAEVAKRIAEDQIAEALRQALRSFVRQVVVEDRPHRTAEASAISPPVTSSRSSKVAGIRDGWQRHLRARYSVGGGQLERLGDCTRDQLIFIASHLDAKAEMNASKARGMRSLAAALTEQGVERVKDLPAELLMNSLGAAA